MIYTNDGLTLAFDAPETSVLEGNQFEAGKLSMTVVLNPINPSNVVTVRYRIDGGLEQILRAVVGESNYQNNTQQFHFAFPNLVPGQTVDYSVLGTCAGRQVTDGGSCNEFPHSFRVARTDNIIKIPQKEQIQQPHRYPLNGDFLARFKITIESPRIAGPTPDGIRVTWNAASGSVAGPRLNAKLLQGADWMLIKKDGIASIDVGALLETSDGSRIVMNYSGIIELGEDGYEKFLSNDLHKSLRVWTTPFFSTGASVYQWLNRRQCISVGEVSIDDLIYEYDVYQLK